MRSKHYCAVNKNANYCNITNELDWLLGTLTSDASATGLLIPVTCCMSEVNSLIYSRMCYMLVVWMIIFLKSILKGFQPLLNFCCNTAPRQVFDASVMRANGVLAMGWDNVVALCKLSLHCSNALSALSFHTILVLSFSLELCKKLFSSACCSAALT